MTTEAELHHLYQQLHGTLDQAGATTMIDILGQHVRHEPATKTDLHLLRTDLDLLEGRLRTEVARSHAALTRVFIASQSVTVAIVGLLIAIT